METPRFQVTPRDDSETFLHDEAETMEPTSGSSTSNRRTATPDERDDTERLEEVEKRGAGAFFRFGEVVLGVVLVVKVGKAAGLGCVFKSCPWFVFGGCLKLVGHFGRVGRCLPLVFGCFFVGLGYLKGFRDWRGGRSGWGFLWEGGWISGSLKRGFLVVLQLAFKVTCHFVVSVLYDRVSLTYSFAKWFHSALTRVLVSRCFALLLQSHFNSRCAFRHEKIWHKNSSMYFFPR